MELAPLLRLAGASVGSKAGILATPHCITLQCDYVGKAPIEFNPNFFNEKEEYKAVILADGQKKLNWVLYAKKFT